MMINFISALLIAGTVFMLGQYSMLFSLMVTVSKVVVALAILAGVLLLYRRYKGSKGGLPLIRSS